MDSAFDTLTPTVVITAIEGAFDVELDGTLEPFPSYVNRVFGVRTEDGEEIIAKFYRPHRWSTEAILEEHSFVAELADAEIPVVPPLLDTEGDSIFEVEVDRGDGREPVVIAFALFPKRGGRGFDAEGDDDWLRLGGLVGRIHNVGRRSTATTRLRVDPVEWTGEHIEYLIRERIVHPEFVAEFSEITQTTVELIQPMFSGVETHRIHGDCHRGNILERPGEGLLLIDFDDMMIGPAIQDLWLLLPDHAEKCYRELSLLSEGYSRFGTLDPGEFKLIEPLRFMRMVHFLSWRAHQRHDDWFRREFPEWGNSAFWLREIEDLREQAWYIRSQEVD